MPFPLSFSALWPKHPRSLPQRPYVLTLKTPLPNSVDPLGQLGRPTTLQSVDRLGHLGRPTASLRSTHWATSVHPLGQVGRPSFTPFRQATQLCLARDHEPNPKPFRNESSNTSPFSIMSHMQVWLKCIYVRLNSFMTKIFCLPNCYRFQIQVRGNYIQPIIHVNPPANISLLIGEQ